MLGFSLPGSEVVMVDQLEAIDVCQVMHLLDTTGQRAHVFKTLFDQFQAEEAKDSLVELPDGDLASLLRFFGIRLGQLALIQAQQADVIAVLVVK